MKTTYKILFSIELLHDFYNHSQEFDDLILKPSPETAKVLSGYRIMYKIFKNRLYALIETDITGKPYISINTSTVLQFHLLVKNPAFKNFTSIKMFNSGSDIFYFSNLLGNKTDTICYLSKAVAEYNFANEYEVGSLAKNGTALFEAIQYNHPSNAHNTSENSFWRGLKADRFPVYTDTFRPEISKGIVDDIQKGTLVFDKPNNKLYEANRLLFKGSKIDLTTTNYWREVANLQYVTSEDITDRSLYKVTGETLGIIELFFDNSVSSDMMMLTNTGVVKEQNYVIRFKNRISTWKYISSQSSVTSITDKNNVFAFTQNGNEFISNAPVPLYAKPFQNFKLTAGIIEIEKLQCASAFLKPDTNTKSFTSEIYLNY